ncbi:MAG TPA: gliding motility lipoprotein GldD [Cryomorphaceae bacterium]|jgi:gliding motility-associated lipoprotein GldD|nr:MAG: hypothetical protein ABR98_05350 [Cryomorphaceae bacterium BACL7 MAG-120910-bin2]KRO69061.1 MAG: hypothetical protein ABR88_01490 [Cryomorphaceae bacterium BACL7 MAG-120322-bin74]KRO82925.1 MAG: hypothetical protein ABR87_00860 [Cryomorphaceae bacterium BACL7 MAG-121220-bin83]NQW24867.1 gliding motility lipoprotein GldD [Cryomorphaceae bacterium]HAB32269.1 gliding motility lipoprotein GldD [Cryomorphaceae bacterium]|tara:strand:- start:1678 stop:2283 length:606 start_codon:yes stop_codon:yes gene_type:complete
MKTKRNVLLALGSVLLLGIVALMAWPPSNTLPKPNGFIRIAPPIVDSTAHSLSEFTEASFPYSMLVHGSAQWEGQSELGWGDIVYPWCQGRMQLTYKPVKQNLATLIDDAHKLAFKHSVVADGISQKLYVNPERKVYGILFHVEGNAASTIQFFATDSTAHFVRGAAYVFAEPNADSLAPVTAFFEKEVIRYLETLTWENI